MLHPSRRLLLVASLTLTAAGLTFWVRQKASPQPDPPSSSAALLPPTQLRGVESIETVLIQGTEEQRDLLQGATHSYKADLLAGQFLHLIVLQDGIDVALRLIGPDGEDLFEIDSPTGTTGEEKLYFVSREAGIHRLEVRGGGDHQAPSGRYTLRVVALQEASDDDRRRAEAEETFHRARTEEDHAQAIAGFSEAAGRFEDLGDPERQADALSRLGKLREKYGDLKGSIAPLEQALDLYRRAGVTRGEAATCNELGVNLERLGEEARAEPFFRRALELGQEIGARDLEATSRTNLGKLVSRRGDSWEALSLLDPALLLWQAEGKPLGAAEVATNLGTIYARLGDPRAALPYFDQALGLAVEDTTEAREQRAVTLTYKGEVLTDLRDFAGADAALSEALSLRAAADLTGQANTRNSRARLAYAQKNLVQARETFLQVQELARRSEDPRLDLVARINLGWVEAALGRLDAGASLFQEALVIARGRDARPAEAAALSGLAWIESRRQDLDAAEEHAEAALDVVESLASDAERRDLRGAFMASRQDAYSSLIDLWMERHRREPLAGHDRQALAISDRSRGRSLLAELNGPDGTFARPRPLSEIRRAALADGSLLLVYHLGEERSYLWAVDSKEVASFVLPGRETLERLAKEIAGLVPQSREPAMEDRLRRKARELAGYLLAPVAGRLGERPLRIVPDGELHSLNFALLPDPALGDRKDSWLLMRHEITYAPSASVLAALHLPRPGRPEPTGEVALVGDAISLFEDDRLLNAPAFAGRDLGLTRFDKGFERLSATGDEIRSILRLVPGGKAKTLLGFEATRDRVLGGALKGFRVLHFATHGVADPNDAGRAALVLSWYEPKGARLDAFLRARDVDQLDLSAELVVLSACETGLGEMVRGEGWVGLPQSFLAAGASEVVVSLGKVSDDSTSRLMPSFYAQMYRHGLPASAALRQAQIAMIRDPAFSAPYHWAGFVAQGAAARDRRRPPPPRTASAGRTD